MKAKRGDKERDKAMHRGGDVSGNRVKSGINGFNATLLKRGFVTAILVVSVLAMFTSVASAADRHVGPGQTYSTIQSAVDAANEGDTIIVHDGTYNENVDVDVAHLTIQSHNGADSTTVQAGTSSDHVFYVTVDYVNISGFNATGATGGWYAGICLYNNVDHCNISDNIVTNNSLFGIYLDGASNNELTNNTANLNDWGIYLHNSGYNELTNNTANENDQYGIELAWSGSSNNILTGNTFNSNNKQGIRLYNAHDNNITCNWVAHNEQEGFHIEGGSTGNNISYNNILSNGVYNATTQGWQWNFYNKQSNAVVAEDNYWGTTSSAVIAAGIKEDTGSVDYDPFLNEPDPCAPIPELATIIAILPGLVVLAGYVWRRRRE